MTLEEAMRYPAALEIVEATVRPVRKDARRKAHRERWWLLAEPRKGLRVAVAALPRHRAVGRHGKRALFSWVEPRWLASDATVVFAFDDDYSFGILTSTTHTAWAWAQSSTFKGDIRYTPSSVFETFAWPDPVTDLQRDAVAEPARRIVELRHEICGAEQIGLTTLYNRVDDGASAYEPFGRAR